MPNRFDTNSVTTPARPNSSISASPTTKGGVMMGRMVSILRNFLNGKLVRVAASAKVRPKRVDALAVHSASHTVGQATPQFLPPVRQLRLQIDSSCILRRKPSGAQLPSLPCSEPMNIRPTG